MTDPVRFVPVNDTSLTESHIRTAVQIAENVFQTNSDLSQIQIEDANIQWTIKHLPFSWILILNGSECIGSAAVLPTDHKVMQNFLSGRLDENALMAFTQSHASQIKDFDCLYLSGVSVLPSFQKRGFGTQALMTAIRQTQSHLTQCRNLYCWSSSAAGRALVNRVEERMKISVLERRT